MDPTRLGSLVDRALADGVLTATEQSAILAEAVQDGVTVAELSGARGLLSEARRDWATASRRLIEARRELATAQASAARDPIRLSRATTEVSSAEAQEDLAELRVRALSRIEVQMAEAADTPRRSIIT